MAIATPREQWKITNISTKTMSFNLGRLKALRPGEGSLDLLLLTTKEKVLQNQPLQVALDAGQVKVEIFLDGILSRTVTTGAALSRPIGTSTGTFTTQDGKTVTVIAGVITAIV